MTTNYSSWLYLSVDLWVLLPSWQPILINYLRDLISLRLGPYLIAAKWTNCARKSCQELQKPRITTRKIISGRQLWDEYWRRLDQLCKQSWFLPSFFLASFPYLSIFSFLLLSSFISSLFSPFFIYFFIYFSLLFSFLHLFLHYFLISSFISSFFSTFFIYFLLSSFTSSLFSFVFFFLHLFLHLFLHSFLLSFLHLFLHCFSIVCIYVSRYFTIASCKYITKALPFITYVMLKSLR